MLINKQTFIAQQFEQAYHANDITGPVKEMLEMKINGEEITSPSSIIKEILPYHNQDTQKQENAIQELKKRFGTPQTIALKLLELPNIPKEKLQESLNDLNNLPTNTVVETLIEKGHLPNDD